MFKIENYSTDDYIIAPIACKWTEKTMEHESDGDANCSWCTRYSHQKSDKEIRGLINMRTNEDHQNDSIIIGQNTEESPGDLRRLTVSQTSVEDFQLTLV